MNRRTLSVLLCIVVLVSEGASAQSDVHDWRNVQNLAPGTEVWVKTAQGRITARVRRADDTTFVLYTSHQVFFATVEQEHVFNRTDVREVRLGKGSLSKLAGAAIGAGVGAGIGLGIESQQKNKIEDGHLVSILLGFFGAAIGVAVGGKAGIVKGAKIYVAP